MQSQTRNNFIGLDEVGEFGNLYYNCAIRCMVWARARSSALAGLAPLVRVSPCRIHIGTTQTDIMPLHTRVDSIHCVLEAYINSLW